MIKGAPVTPEASTISGASATTEVQNNSAEVQNNSASASDPVDAEAPAKILIPLEHCERGQMRNSAATWAMLHWGLVRERVAAHDLQFGQ